MEKPSLLYASPFPPMKSGISDYSTALVKALDSKFNITLFTDNYVLEEKNMKKYPVVRYGVDKINFDHYDYIIYNIGNNPEYHSYIYEAALKHPGMIILHDFVIYYLFIGYYKQKNELYSSVYSKLGHEDFQKIKDAVKQNGIDLLQQKHLTSILPMNKEIIESNNKIMVHSKFSYEKLIATGLIERKRVAHINHIQLLEDDFQKETIERRALFKKYNIPLDTIIISSFGYIAETKLNKEVCKVVRAINENSDIKVCYVMVGAGEYADAEIDGKNAIKTGYTELDEFNSFVQYSDIIVNLRYPSMGETSGSMLRILQLGKCCVTNNGGWFSEIPDTCVCKIDVENVEAELKKTLSELITNKKRREIVGINAQEYIQDNYNAHKITQQIWDFVTK